MVNKEKTHKKILNIFAIILLILVSINMIIHIATWSDGWTEFFWYCNSAAALLSFGILFKKTPLISVVLVGSIPAQGLWILDFILTTLGFHALGRTAELFQYSPFIIALSIALHFLLIPISIYATYVYGFSKKIITISLLFILYLFIPPYFLSDPADNINCVFYPCDSTIDTASLMHPIIGYMSWQYAVYVMLKWILMLIIAYYIFNLLFQKLFKKIKVN
jgi:hypothetical protein